MSQLEPIVNQPNLYVNGLMISNDATAPDTVLNISAGICRDSNNEIDINLGNYLNLSGIGSANASTSVNTDVVGFNGIDTGVLQASKVYYVFVIADSSNKNLPGALVSLSATAPVLPFGYDSIRLIGYMVTDSSADFLLCINSGNGNARLFTYDVPIATAVTAGNSATYADVALGTFVPAVANLPVLIECDWTANAAADTLALHARNATGDTVKYIAPVAGATAHTLVRDYVQAQLDSGLPEIQYKVSAGTVAINVAGFQYFI